MEARGDRVAEAAALMAAFAARTGLGGASRTGARYLWTDAFAVCNFLALGDRHGLPNFLSLAPILIDRVHQTLGRHRADEELQGWLSGLADAEAARHPTRGGLRIGKPGRERHALEPFDARGEWDRDGQYFHYLTKWMHALDRAAVVLKRPDYNVWARELAATACGAFVQPAKGGARPRLFWKMSIDLTRPQVSSMGQHDALDGLLTLAQLRHTAIALGVAQRGPDLADELALLGQMLEPEAWATVDPLGLGGLLFDASRGAQLWRDGAMGPELVEHLLVVADEGLRRYLATGELQRPATRRLAFRELGLAIGAQALDTIDAPALAGGETTRRLFAEVKATSDALASQIEACWRAPRHRQTSIWLEHVDINEVMLATSLVPEGFLPGA